jgi:hypothetical protein
MSVFTAVADESASGDGSGQFYFGGFIAPERDWDESFTPAWRERVLGTKPPLDYLHDTEIKDTRWRAENGVTESEAERKLDEAFRVIRSQGSLYLLTAQLDATRFRTTMHDAGIQMSIQTPGGRARKPFNPDYICFVRFALHALLYAHDEGGTRVDFVVEDNKQITPHVEKFHGSLHGALKTVGRDDLGPLVGNFVRVSKPDVRAQAADLLCYYGRKSEELSHWSRADIRRFYYLAERNGMKARVSDEDILELVEGAQSADAPPVDAIGWIESNPPRAPRR